MYGELSGARAYHAARGNAAWASASDDDLNSALLRASVYIDSRYRHQYPTGAWVSMFSGAKTGGRNQEREWPRSGASDYEGNSIPADDVPLEVVHATYEAAERERAIPGSLSPDYVPSQIAIKEKVGPIEVQYMTGSSGNPVRPIVSAIDEIIAPVIIGSSLSPGVLVV